MPARKPEPEAEPVEAEAAPELPEAAGAPVYIRHTDSGAVGVVTRRQWDDLYSQKADRSGAAWWEVTDYEAYAAQVADHEEQQAAEAGRVIEMLQTDPDSFLPVVAEAKQVAAGDRPAPADVDPDKEP